MDRYIQIKEATKKWEIGERRINELCLNDRIKGAVKFGNTWAIPANSEKLVDARIKRTSMASGLQILHRHSIRHTL